MKLEYHQARVGGCTAESHGDTPELCCLLYEQVPITRHHDIATPNDLIDDRMRPFESSDGRLGAVR